MTPSIGDPFEQLAGLHVQCRAEPVERVRRKAAELQLGVGQAVRRRHRKARLTCEAVRRPTLPFEDCGEMKAEQRHLRPDR